jgi:L-alanine-DL-glutamate epimerase-like enolase superfamily enzyme
MSTMNYLDEEVFHIKSIRIRTLKEVPVIYPFQDSTMGPFRFFNLSVLTLTDRDGQMGEAPVFRTYSNIFEHCICPVLFQYPDLPYKELYPKLYWSIRNEGFRGPASSLLGQLDLALLDLTCRKKGQPLYKFLGADRNYARVYGSGGGTNYTYAQLEKEAAFFLDQGMDCIKMKVGKDFGTRMEEDIERVKFMRRLIGGGIRLAVDANQIWNVEEALAFSKAVENEDIAWFEEPVHSASLTDIRMLCGQSSIPIAFGESERSGKVFPELVSAGVTHLQPTPTHLSSIGEWMGVRDMATRAGLEFSSGGYSLYTAALMTTSPERFQVEYLYTLMGVVQAYFSEQPILRDGKFVLPDIAGLPIRLNWDYLESTRQVIAQKNWKVEKSGKYKPAVLL